ncbi:hypothetical protein [Priestia taiwanensis]|uniref:Uncharacterized protein n=1 Tax=Priestia taiwanensis TaxID=1347902 RepID=A0A917AUE0_9BACI|nr:hypothetical protein [Priestia taiwanensis]MBM7363662.1 lauroyl/myristoyl acyltransferase [Priestia taiwanensis]GGE75122.1 hypothetical protein GCM10007140_26240 [Priestia taiwanensis]
MSYCSMTKTIKQANLNVESVKEELLSELSKELTCSVLSSDATSLKVLIKPITKSKRYMKLVGEFTITQTDDETAVKFFGQYKMTPKGLGSMLFGIFVLPLAGAGIFVLAAIFKKNNTCMQEIHAALKKSMIGFYDEETSEIKVEDSLPQSI